MAEQIQGLSPIGYMRGVEMEMQQTIAQTDGLARIVDNTMSKSWTFNVISDFGDPSDLKSGVTRPGSDARGLVTYAVEDYETPTVTYAAKRTSHQLTEYERNRLNDRGASNVVEFGRSAAATQLRYKDRVWIQGVWSGAAANVDDNASETTDYPATGKTAMDLTAANFAKLRGWAESSNWPADEWTLQVTGGTFAKLLALNLFSSKDFQREGVNGLKKVYDAWGIRVQVTNQLPKALTQGTYSQSGLVYTTGKQPSIFSCKKAIGECYPVPYSRRIQTANMVKSGALDSWTFNSVLDMGVGVIHKRGAYTLQWN